MNMAPHLAGSMELARSVPDASRADSDLLLVVLTVLLAVVAGRMIVLLAPLIGVLFRAIAQLLWPLVLLLVCLGFIAAWGCHQLTDTAGITPAAGATAASAVGGNPE